ncbi:MAG: transcriptional regulator, AraC family [Hydrocarboniphaga sp.]|uniref:AraC family transcriptional regulator n=1 Tax=Hydrocarboniphaga sp. TaxID=2033016 RepID=UPI00260329FE|nr:AraC family transcriptional regulator [Hydrocarboniphaga sp.]MDB5971151.1 transcriptional regulator, AraC family [Hydrocarboniphaga sp.]
MRTPNDHVDLVRDAPSGIEAIRARFSAHAYDMHRHDEWLIGVKNFGVQEFTCRGVRCRSTLGRVILIEPGEAHDGDAGSEEGFDYTMLYLPNQWLKSIVPSGIGSAWGFAETLMADASLGGAIRETYDALRAPSARLHRDALLDKVVHLLLPHLGRAATRLKEGRAERVARRARERLHDMVEDDIGADALAIAAGAADRFQLARAFRTEYGASPHAYLVQIRLIRARQLLAAGKTPVEAAAACGFADQSHLGRWFRRAFALTPAAYREQCTGIPDGGRQIG